MTNETKRTQDKTITGKYLLIYNLLIFILLLLLFIYYLLFIIIYVNKFIILIITFTDFVSEIEDKTSNDLLLFAHLCLQDPFLPATQSPFLGILRS